MRLPQSAASLLLSLPTLASAITINCADIKVKGKLFNLEALAGDHYVRHMLDRGGTQILNVTYSLNVCGPLEDVGSGKEQCNPYTKVCAISRFHKNESGEKGLSRQPEHWAGNFENRGFYLEPRFALLQDPDGHADPDREGLRLDLNGGRDPLTKKGKKLKTIVEFVCDKSVVEPNESRLMEKNVSTKEDDDGEDLPEDESDTNLAFVSEAEMSDIRVLRLEWRTKWACVGMAEEAEANAGSHWGFFTWLFIIVFLSTAAYLIFGSWLNYNRYGARGWDLVPHGDTIRDVPYLLKDWARGIASAAKGDGLRGGYTAV